ncbi:hypothetical protein Q604_UNBC07666G0001, partial [human gut metagenome]
GTPTLPRQPDRTHRLNQKQPSLIDSQINRQIAEFILSDQLNPAVSRITPGHPDMAPGSRRRVLTDRVAAEEFRRDPVQAPDREHGVA